MHSPLYVHQAANGFRYVNGTPADCVHVALTGLLGYRPDLVVSGINNGANMGDDTIYSGTVGAAMEGYLFGIPAIAFSQTQKGWAHLDAAARKARELVQRVLAGPVAGAAPWLLNVNIPNLPYAELKPFKVCRLGRRHAAEKVISQTSPHGETMYWIGGAGPAKDSAEGHRLSRHRPGPCVHHPAEGRPHRSRRSGRLGAGCGPAGRSGRGGALNVASSRLPRAAGRLGGGPRHQSHRPRRRRRPPSGDQRPAALASTRRRCALRMVQRLAAQGVSDAQVLSAMGSVERHRFVDTALVNQAYEDTSLPIGLGQTISKPNVVARMIELLLGGAREPSGRLGRVLEIGTGCGYQAAVLSLVAAEVYSIERLRGLHEKARANLRHFRLPNVHLLFGDGMAGYAKGAPYAGIIAAAGGESVPLVVDRAAGGGRTHRRADADARRPAGPGRDGEDRA